MANSRQVDVVTILPDTSKEVPLDVKLVSRAFDNLLSNALKFSPKKSTITIRLDYVQNGSDLSTAPPSFCVEVIDQGPGIPEKDRERIFDKYEVIKSERKDIPQVGLGLALCKMVVEAHGGRIYVRDNHPTRAIFTVEI